MSFDPTSCGRDSWRWMEFVEDVTFEPNNEDAREVDRRSNIDGAKVRPADMTSRSVADFAATLGLSTEETLLQFWPNSELQCEIQAGDFLRRPADWGWTVNRATRSPFGFWVLACVRERRNVAVSS